MVPSYYEFYNPVRIISGFKALENLPYELEQLGVKRPLIVTDKGVLAAGLLRPVLTGFIGSGIRIGGIFNDVPQDSEKRVVNTVASVFWRKQCDCFVALGGGSVIDTAKGANIVVSERADDLMAFAGADILQKPLKPLIVIPTTSGTGSEVTVAAVISDTRRGVKMAFTSRHLLPRLAVLDPRMTRTLPPKMTAATGMDALTHAVEASICLQKNPVSDAHAHAAIRLIAEHLVPVTQNSGPDKARLALANAACLAGAAFSNSMVGMVHALGHACGAVSHIPHGMAMSILLPHGLEYNFESAQDILGQLLLPLAGPESFAATPAHERGRAFIRGIRQLRADLEKAGGLPRTLSAAGVKPEALPAIAQTAVDDPTVIFNPREMSQADALAVLEAAFEAPS